jgi:cytochrome b561
MAKNNPHLITSRDYESAGRTLILLAFVFLIIFTLCSAYAIVIQPGNPAAWSMLAFFAIPLILLLFYEKNAFPDIPRNKMLPASISWFFTWMFVAFFVSAVFTSSAAHLAMAILFGFIVAIGSVYTVANERQWERFKARTGGKVKSKVKRKKTKKKKPKKKQKFARF